MNVPLKAGIEMLRRIRNAEVAMAAGLPQTVTQAEADAAWEARGQGDPNPVKIFDTMEEFRDSVLLPPVVTQQWVERRQQIVSLLMKAASEDPQKMAAMLQIAGLDPSVYL